MRPSVIKKKLKDGKPALLTQLHLTDASIFEMVSVMGFDGIWMDLERYAWIWIDLEGARTQKPGTRNQEPEPRIQKPKPGNQKPETRT